jgi:predicted ATPase/class 3 adenylate cyclase/DNA-binding CsgD family transcriptional regulator
MTTEPPVRPVGTVTLLFTDVVRSTAAWEADPDAMAVAMRRHHQLLDEAVATHGGVRAVEQGAGDSIVAGFDRAADAVGAALLARRLLAEEPWRGVAPITLRMALHSGDVEVEADGAYSGPTMNRCGRLLAAANDGQVIVSISTYALAIDGVADRCVFTDLGNHRLRDVARPLHVYQVDEGSEPRRFPPLRTLDGTPNNVPMSLTSFIGREDAVDELDDLLDGARVVTLTGSGGCGKTRLACQVAHATIERWPDGVWFVDLASVRDDEDVPFAISDVLSLHVPAGAHVLDRVVDHLRDHRALVVLDNCEHLLGPCAAAVDRLVGGCPNLGVLVTSREPLGLHGERVWRIPSLSLPRGDAAADDLVASEAGRLFVERIRLVRPAYVVTDDDVAPIAAICRRLDGIPLALELAAARCRTLSPARIAAELDDRFRLFTGGGRNVLPRQRTLEASVAWSYGLLIEDERRALRRLSVFAGGFTLDAADEVLTDTDGSSAAAGDGLDLVSQLVDKSLLECTDDGSTSGRFAMLETVRHFAGSHLIEAGEAEAARARHLRYFTGWADGYRDRFRGPEAAAAVAAADAELDNVRAAMSWAAGIDDVRSQATIVGALSDWFTWRGHMRERATWLSQLRPRLDELEPDERLPIIRTPVVWDRLDDGVGDIMEHQQEEAMTSLETVRATGDPSLIGRTMVEVGSFLAMWRGSSDGRRLLADAIPIARTANDVLAELWAAEVTVTLALLDGRLAEAVAGLDDLDTRVRDYGDPRIVSEHHTNRGWAAVEAGRPAAARHEVHAARAALAPLSRDAAPGRLVVADHTLQASLTAVPLVIQARADLAQGRAGDSRQPLVDLINIAMQQADHAYVGWLVVELARIDIVEGRPARARKAGEAVLSQSSPLITHYRTRACELLALAAAAAGDTTAAAQLWDDQLADARSLDNDALGATARLHLGALHRSQGRHAIAKSLVHDALETFAADDRDGDTAAALRELGGLALDARNLRRAARLIGAADAIDEELGVSYRIGLQPAHDRDREVAAGDALAEAYDAGRAMSLDEAVKFAARGRGQRRRPAVGWESLTPTEEQVLDLVKTGMSNPEIGTQLLMSPATVKTHLTNIYRKVDVTNRTQLVATLDQRP